MIIKNECSIICQVPKDVAFKEFSHIQEYYNELSPGHKQYILNGKFAVGAVINVIENAGFQHVHHTYQVTEFINNSKVSLISPISKVRVFGIFPSKSSSHVEFIFTDNDNCTKINLIICIKFNSLIRYLLARVFMTKFIWALHAQNELKSLARIIEKRTAITKHKEGITSVNRTGHP